MGRISKNSYQIALKHIVKLTDDTKQYSSYIENHHVRTNSDKNLISTDPKAIKNQLSQPQDIIQILQNLHIDLLENQDALKRDGLTIGSFTDSVKVYWDVFTQGYESGSSRTGILAVKNLPNLVDFFKVFDWLNKVIQVSNEMFHETRSRVMKAEYIQVEDEANNALREFRRFILPFTKAFQDGFIKVAKKELTIANKETVYKYQALTKALQERSWILGEDGLGITTPNQKELKAAIKPRYTQDKFFNHSVEFSFNSINKVLDESLLKEARHKIIEILTNFETRSDRSKKELALAISYQLTPEGLTLPQKIIQLTNEPEDQEQAFGILLELQNFNVKFDGRDQKLNTCLHSLKTWHQTIAQFLTLIDDSSSKTAVNASNQIPVEVLEKKFDSNDPYFNIDSFAAIRSLLNPESIDSRTTLSIQ